MTSGSKKLSTPTNRSSVHVKNVFARMRNTPVDTTASAEWSSGVKKPTVLEQSRDQGMACRSPFQDETQSDATTDNKRYDAELSQQSSIKNAVGRECSNQTSCIPADGPDDEGVYLSGNFGGFEPSCCLTAMQSAVFGYLSAKCVTTTAETLMMATKDSNPAGDSPSFEEEPSFMGSFDADSFLAHHRKSSIALNVEAEAAMNVAAVSFTASKSRVKRWRKSSHQRRDLVELHTESTTAPLGICQNGNTADEPESKRLPETEKVVKTARRLTLDPSYWSGQAS